MDEVTFETVRDLIERNRLGRLSLPIRVAEIGSMVVNKRFPHGLRELMPRLWTYTGFDVASGPNVDIVMPEPYVIPAEPFSRGLVMCIATLEHVVKPWSLVCSMTRLVSQSGCLLLAIPGVWKVHRYPLDCWRVLPDGMRALIEDVAGLTVHDIWETAHPHGCSLTWGIGLRSK